MFEIIFFVHPTPEAWYGYKQCQLENQLRALSFTQCCGMVWYGMVWEDKSEIIFLKQVFQK